VAAKRKSPMTTVHSQEEIPAFASEAEEAAFWATHELADNLWDRLPRVPDEELPPARPRTRPVGIRFDESTLERIKVLAARRHKGYQTLLREFITERLYEEEQREGLVRPVRGTAARRRSRSGAGGPRNPLPAE
jgi:predicted DNA binding CopG/RHH family protein